MKSKILKMLGVLLVLSLMLVAFPATPVSANGPSLSISVEPPDGSTFFCGDTPTLIATVSNASGAECAEDVVITAAVTSDPAFATLSNPNPADGLLYDICPDSGKQASWTLTCDGPGPVTVQFTATPTNGDPVVETVTYNQICRVGVEITKPTDGDSFNVSDTFAVTALVTNNDGPCADVTVTLTIVGNAMIVGGNATYTIDLLPRGTEEVNWTVHCTDIGDVELTVTANGCGQNGDGDGCAAICADTIIIHQPPVEECGLDLVITSDPVGEICVGTSFTIEGYIENTGTKTLTGVDAQLTATDHASSVSIVPSGWNLVTSSLAPGATVPVSWTVTCEGRELQGGGEECLDELIDFLAEARATCDTYDDTTDSETLLDYANQKFVIVTITWPENCTDICVNDEIDVTAEVKNCFEGAISGTITIWPNGIPAGVTLITANQNQALSIAGGGTATVPIPWHIKCLAGGDVDIVVRFLGISPPGGPGTTGCDDDTVTIHQKTPADINVVVDAPDCAQYCDIFDVTATVTNPGGADAAPVSNVNVVMTATGDVELVSGPSVTGDTDQDGLLDQDETWVYTWKYHCNGPYDADFDVDVTGTDAVCGGTLVDGDFDSTEQVKLDIEIISPEACSTKIVCDTFCVTAEITDNDPDTCFYAPLTAVISFPNGKASLVVDETNTRDFQLLDGDTQQVSWTVHCDEPGDTDIQVEVTGYAGNPEGCDDCTLYDKKDTITIHQITPPDLKIEILSPDDNTTVATSQDFAVTVKLTNSGQADIIGFPLSIWAEPSTAASVVDPEAFQPIDVPGESSVTITWTLHCDEQGVTLINVGVPPINVIFDSVLILQYPAAHLEVEILDVYPDTTINACDEFTIHYKIKNTGEADATEVEAILSVTPEGSARPVEGIGSGYTQYIGTIPAHGETGVLSWQLHCKQVCESTIVITATGNDEYGWHKKQECQSTGTFVIYEGYEYFETLYTYELDDPYGEYAAWTYGYFEGDANGLIGPFNFDAGLQFAALGGGPDFLGHITGMGMVIPNASDDGDDVLAWIAHVTLDEDFEGIYKDIWEFSVCGGLLQVINGNLNGAYLKGYEEINNGSDCIPQWEVGLLNGTYCSTMASTPGMAILTEFIEPATVTVKQLEPESDLEVTKTVDATEPVEIGTEVTFTVTVENLGPSGATSVLIADMLPAGLNFVAWYASQGYYYVSSGYWDVGDLDHGDAFLYITAEVNAVGDIENMAAVYSADQHDPDTGNNADTATVTGMEPEPIETVELVEGYNLISLPLIPEDSDIETLLLGLDVIKVAAYSPFQEWRFYDPDPLVPDDLTEMEDGWGYWIDMATAGTLSYPGYELCAPPPAVPPSYNVVEGWNLIGFKATTPKLAAEYLASIVGKYVIIYGYEGGSYFIVGTPGHEYLQPGLGYWIAMIDPGTIYP